MQTVHNTIMVVKCLSNYNILGYPIPQGEMEHGDTNWNGIWRTGPLPHSSLSLCYLGGILADNPFTYKYSYKLFVDECVALYAKWLDQPSLVKPKTSMEAILCR